MIAESKRVSRELTEAQQDEQTIWLNCITSLFL